jgi:hypothetical protein
VVRLGDCSAVAIRPNIVLTCAHCVEGDVRQAIGLWGEIPIVRCVQHPEFRASPELHDIGFCELAAPISDATVEISEDSQRPVGAAVTLAGYGTTSPFARDANTLRVVETTVSSARAGVLEVGTSDRTACWGDSGGAVLVPSQGNLRLIGIVRGSSGAICASPATVVPLEPHLPWLVDAVGLRPAHRTDGASLGLWAVVAFAALIGLLLWIRRARRHGWAQEATLPTMQD